MSVYKSTDQLLRLCQTFGLAALLLLQACSPPGLHRGSDPQAQQQELQDFQDHQQEGLASWYGPNFHGQATASGEIYNMYELSAAHRILPLGSKARVTNLENDKSITVRINERGPFVQGRILDLAYAAARELEMIKSGTGRVRLKVLDLPQRDSSRAYYIQVGSFRSRGNAAQRLSQLKKDGYAKTRMIPAEVSGQRFWRVQAGPYPERAKARGALQELSQSHPASFMIAD